MKGNVQAPIHIGSSEQFDSIIATGVVVIDFYADWCGPCRMLWPIMENLAAKYEWRVTVVKVNVDDFGDIASQFGVSSIPMVAIFNNGSMVGEAIVWAYPQDHYETVLDWLLS